MYVVHIEDDKVKVFDGLSPSQFNTCVRSLKYNS